MAQPAMNKENNHIDLNDWGTMDSIGPPNSNEAMNVDQNLEQGFHVNENVGQCSSTAPLNKGNVPINTNDPNNSSPSLSMPTSYAKLLSGEPSRNVSPTTRKSVNFRTLITPAGNEADVAALLESIRAISKRFENTTHGFFLEKRVAYLIVANYVRNTWSKYGLVKSILNSSNGCSSCKVFGHVLDECPKNIGSDVVKNLKNPRQATRGVQVGPKVGFKPTKQVYIPVSNKISASNSGKKKQAELSSQKVRNSNPFDALNSVEDVDDLGMNGGNSKSHGKRSLNVAHGSSSNTIIIEKIDKLERQILDGKLTFVNNDGKSLYKAATKGNKDSKSEVEVVFHEIANLMASTSLKGGTDSGYGTNSLLEQWRKTKPDDDYDPYCNTPKLGRSGIMCPGALLHRSIAQDMRTASKRVV
ncbi:hypothetical protein Tco_1109225 [Tanacetum coccineum]